jgi:hypothetical protein
MLHQDFDESYLDALQEKKNAVDQRQRMLQEHEVWRQTTWGGWATRQVQAVGRHFSPFFLALSDAVSGEAEASALSLRILVMSASVFGGVALFYLIARVLKVFVGRQLVITQEVIMEHEEEEEDDDSGVIDQVDTAVREDRGETRLRQRRGARDTT